MSTNLSGRFDGVAQSGLLDLGFLDLETLPDEARRFSQDVTSLNLEGNKLESLPEWLEEFSKLRVVVLRDNRFSIVPRFVGAIESSLRLDVSGNRVSSLSADALLPIEVLILSDNPLSAASGELVLPRGLRALKLDSCDLERIDHLLDGSGLLELDVRNNRLASLGASFNRFENLERLRLDGNRLTDLPSDFGSLSSLTHLGLSGNLLEVLPECVADLRKLRNLDISRNRIVAGPDLADMDSLTSLLASENRISDMSPFLTPDLSTLNLSSNLIHSLPEVGWDSVRLSNLDLSWNLLESVPGGMTESPNLVSLFLYGNRVRPDSLPAFGPGVSVKVL